MYTGKHWKIVPPRVVGTAFSSSTIASATALRYLNRNFDPEAYVAAV